MKKQTKKRLSVLVASAVAVQMLPMGLYATGVPYAVLQSSTSTASVVAAAIESGLFTNAAFGDGANKDGNSMVDNGDSIVLVSENNRGKMASSADGINFLYAQLSAKDNFELSTVAKVQSFDANNQVSFGLMLRDLVDADGVTDKESAAAKSAMLGVGGLRQKLIGFTRAENGSAYTEDYVFNEARPASGSVYNLKIQKSGDTYALTSNGDTYVYTSLEGLFTDNIFAGVYTSRNTKVEYTDLNLAMVDKVGELKVTKAPTKTTYLQGQDLNLDGLTVTADGKEVPLSSLIVYGYDNETVGAKSVTVEYGGAKTTFDVEVKALTCTELKLIPTPAKTTYYLGDSFDAAGMSVQATFNSGEVRVLEADEYEIASVDLSKAGRHQVTVTYKGASEAGVKATFSVVVEDDELTVLEVTKAPTKEVYYLGEELDLKGLVVSAIYEDEKVLLTLEEYTVDASGFDTASPGEKSVVLKHKDQQVKLDLVVKQKAAVGLALDTYPQTTLQKGASFSEEGMVVGVLYDNGDLEVLEASAYTVDASKVDASKAGVYPVTVKAADASLAPFTFNVSVVEPVSYEWKTISFGQSISKARNFVETLEDGTVRLTALEGGGKITNSFQDGISYYYTELDNTADNFELSADIKVIDFAKPTPDNQEGFGIMARDAIGTDLDSSVFYANIAAVGGYRGVTQMVMRSGVTDSDSSGAGTGLQQATVLDNTRPALGNTYPEKEYRLTLKKTNTGFIGQLNDGEEILYFEPDALGVQNDTLYVGFYAARLATIEVSNIDFKVTKAATDAPKVEAPAEPVEPSFEFVSLKASPLNDYTLKLFSNVNGTATIKQGEKIIARDVPVLKGRVFEQKTYLQTGSETPFTVTFIPSTDQNLTSYDKQIKTNYVSMKSYQAVGTPLYVSPSGTKAGDGTQKAPLDIQTAIDFVKPGQTIYLLEGTYKLDASIGVEPGNNGTKDARKVLSAAPGAKVVIDSGKKVAGFNLDGDYWHVFGIDFTGAISTGFRVGGNHNIVELCNTYANGDTGMQISRYGDGGFDTWPSYNLILNCTSYDNIDASENNADGFAAKLTVGNGNIFRGCIAHNNIDDAWDLFAKGSTGAIGAVLIEDSIAYENGMLSNGYVGAGDKNGFKLGGEGIAVPHVIRNSIAFNNLATGFSSNSNPAVISKNNVSYDNVGPNFDWRVYTDVTPRFQAEGNISYRSEAGVKDVYPASLVNKTNFFYNGEVSANSEGVVLTEDNFKSLVAPEGYERAEDGSIIFGDFLSYIQ